MDQVLISVQERIFLIFSILACSLSLLHDNIYQDDVGICVTFQNRTKFAGSSPRQHSNLHKTGRYPHSHLLALVLFHSNTFIQSLSCYHFHLTLLYNKSTQSPCLMNDPNLW